jgi:cytochrome P450
MTTSREHAVAGADGYVDDGYVDASEFLAPFEQAQAVGFPDPYPTFAELRAQGGMHARDVLQEEFGFSSPIVHAGQRPVFSALGYDAATQVMRDGGAFSNAVYAESMGLVMGRNILMMDGAEHRDKRRLLQSAFTRRSVEAWRVEVIRPIIEGAYLKRLVERGRADLMRDFAVSFPVSVIHRILGLPNDHRTDFHRWAAELLFIEFDPMTGLAASQALGEHLLAVMKDRRNSLGDDVISTLLRAEEDGLALNDEDVLGFIRLMLPAGAETTMRTTGTVITALLSDPDQLERVREDRSLIPRAVEEAMRWQSPVQIVFRVCTSDTSVEGVDIPADTVINVVLGSANRDESRFPDPDRFDLDRVTDGHLGFAFGPHLCIGLHLGRMEAEVAVNALLDRLPNLRLDPDAPPPEFSGLTFRGPVSIPVVWD